MKIRKNFRLTSLRREEMVQLANALQLTKAEAARIYGVCAKYSSALGWEFQKRKAPGEA